MSLIKEPDAIAVDQTSKAVQELVESLSVCLGVMQDEDTAFTLIERLRDDLASALSAFRGEVRELGFLPADGNIERAEVEALLMKAKAMFGIESEISVMRAGLRDQAALALSSIDASLADDQADDAIAEAISGLRERVLVVSESLSKLDG